MKKILMLLVILATVLVSCEKKSQSFESSRIPGEYDTHAYVFEKNDSTWSSNSTIPQSFFNTHEGFPCEINSVGEDHCSLSFGTTATSLQNNLELEITRITEFSTGGFRAYVKVVDSEYYLDTLLSTHLPSEVNCFWHNDLTSLISFNIILKSKVQDDLILDITGSK